MMWGAISYAQKTQLVHIPSNFSAARYRDEVLTPHMLPAMNLRREVFQHDNARPYTARATVDFLANQNVTILHSPYKSPDLNPIATCDTSNYQHHFKYRNKHYITLKIGTLVVQTSKFIQMSLFITLKSIVFR
jgi:hypothetical protein